MEKVEDKNKLNECYDKIAKYNKLIDLGGNRYQDPCSDNIFILTPFGYVDQRAYNYSKLDEEYNSSDVLFFSIVSGIPLIIGFIIGLLI